MPTAVPAAMTDLPEIGDAVAIRDPDGGTYPSRVEDLADECVTIAKPELAATSEPYDETTELLLTWTLADRVMVVPVALTRSHAQGSVRLWDLGVAGDGWTEQRRAHVRVEVTEPVTLVPITRTLRPSADADDVLRGWSVDVSEAAMQCVVDGDIEDASLAIGARVQAQFVLRGTMHEYRGQVRFHRAANESGQVRLVVAFEHTQADADALRREVFAAQLDARRSQRG